ncbi:hypothetical protein GQ44DRAFT_719454 [Phaeosphaeriaceae sp. PMI808]|nr:hypothetical protein GQ44DRAFT_719454 [Phaeosphaeriaceae sp. PMI808]
MPSTGPKILLAGLRVDANIPEYFRTLYGTPDEIASKIKADSNRIQEAGYAVTTYYMDDRDPQTGLDWLAAKLSEEKFNGIMIGSGLRLLPPQTAFFEKVMNVVSKLNLGGVLMFNDGPGGNFEAIMRNKEALG